MAISATLTCTFVPVSLTTSQAYGSPAVNGGGSSFAAPEASQWTADVARKPYDLNISYVNSSSGAGRNQYASGNYDYGASDIVYNAEDGSEATSVLTQHPFKYVTITAGGLAFEYNLVINGVKFTSLELTRKDVCQIFTGEVRTWSQLANTAPTDAPLAALGTQPILAVIRQDSAGESYVLSQYCISVDPGDWNTFKNWIDANINSVNWSGDPNMAMGLPVSYWPGTLYNSDQSVLYPSGAPSEAQDADDPNEPGAIGYVATAYAKQLGAPVAAVQNGAGDFTLPDANSVQLALSYAHANSLGTFNLDFTGSNPAAYFPSTYSYVIDPTTTKTPDPGINAPLNQWLCYSIGGGQQEAAPLNYAPLSAQVTALSVAAIEATPDAPPASSCGIGGPQPTVTANGGGITGNNGTSDGSGGGGSSGSGAGSSGGGASGSGGLTAGNGSSASNSSGLAGATGGGGSANSTGAAAGSSGLLSSNGALAVTSAQGSPGDPIGNQALWWVLGGFVLAAGAAGLAGLSRKESS